MARDERPWAGTAPARVGLLGNPSDGFGGKVLSFAIADFGARAELGNARGIQLGTGDAPAETVGDLDALQGALAARRLSGGGLLLGAATAELAAAAPSVRALVDAGVGLRFWSDVPRQVGLAGSSAIVIAALRALCAASGTDMPPAEMAEVALRAETARLGIAAGPQDRVIQCYGGLVWMDFSTTRTPSSYVALDPALLPPLFVAWDRAPGTSSGVVHDDVRARWQRGEPAVVQAIQRFPRIAERGVACLRRGDLDGLRACVDENFNTRAAIWQLAARDHEMVRLGREHGAAVKFCGSGGAVVGLPRSERDLPVLAAAYERAGFGFAQPSIAPAQEE